MQLIESESIVVDPLYPVNPDVFQNPYPFYKALREHKPVFWNPEKKWWILSRYDDVTRAFRDPALATRWEPRLHKLFAKIPAPLHCPFAGIIDRLRLQDSKGHWLPGKNPPIHTQIKKFLNPFFAPSRLQRLAPDIERLCHETVDKHSKDGHMDIIADLAFPIPFSIIMQMLDLPKEDLPRVEQWCRQIFPIFGIFSSPEVQRNSNNAIESFTSFLMPIVEKRRKCPGDDLISGLLSTTSDGFRLSNREVAANSVLMGFAGFETTETSLGNGLLALLRNPEQFELLKENPQLLESAVEEIFRYDPAVQFETRVASQPLEIRGHLIKPGDTVHAFQASANRDSDYFENPEEFDITRTNNKHLAFGLGIHYCIGAPLARLEAQVAFRVIAERLPNVKLRSNDVEFEPQLRPRSLKSLPVTF